MTSGDYIIPIKGNQENFYNDLKLYFDSKKCEEIIASNSNSIYYSESEKNIQHLLNMSIFKPQILIGILILIFRIGNDYTVLGW